MLSFCKKFENYNGRHFGKRKKIFKMGHSILQKSLGPKISMKSLFLAPLRRYEQFCVLTLSQKNLKIQNGRWADYLTLLCLKNHQYFHLLSTILSFLTLFYKLTCKCGFLDEMTCGRTWVGGKHHNQ